MHSIYLCLILCLFPNSIYAGHILSIFGSPIPTQYAFIEPLLKELASRGHQITSVTNYPQKEPLKNFRDVVVTKNKYLFDVAEFNNFTLDNISSNYYEVMDGIYSRGIQMCVNIQNDPTYRHIVKYEKIDLIILDIFFSESFFGLAEYTKAPLVGISTMGTMISIDELVGNISPTSYIPHILLPLREMGFWQRLLNLILNIVDLSHYYYKYMPIQKQLYNFYYPHAKMTFEEAQKNFSLVLLNDHFTLSTPRPYVPNMIEVAGLNVVTNPDPIIPSVKYLLDTAQNGVILINLDVNMDSYMVDIFIKQFKSMPQLILWKTPKTISHTLPNLYVDDKFNEASILAHPKIQLYVTTGSYLSIIESIYHGLPILGIYPTDRQDDFVGYIKRFGNGLSIKLHGISESILAKTFNELLTSPNYRNVAKTLSFRFRDQQNTPMEIAVYWIEYVLRHNGAAHLRNKGQSLSWWQFYNIDVIVVILLLSASVITLALFIVKFFIKFIWNLNVRSTIVKNKKVQ